MKRVLLTLYFHRDLNIEGGGTLLPELARALCEKGYAPTVLAPLEGSSDDPYPTINSRANGDGSYRAYRNQLGQLAKDFDCVWLIEQSPATGALHRGALPAGPGVVRLITSPYQTLDELFQGPHSLQYLKHWIGKNKLLARLRAHEGTMVVSTAYQRDQMIRLGLPAERVHIIPYGIAGNGSEPPSKAVARHEYELPDRPLVSYLGHYSPIKGVPVLAKAFRAVAAANPEVHLALAWSGKGDDARKVHRLLADPALKGRVHERGIVRPLHFLSASDVTVLPFVHSSFPHLPLVMIEAFATGTPIVTSDIGGIRDMVVDGETGLLVPPNDPAALAAAIERLLGDQELRERISANQLGSFRARYSSTVAVERLLEIS